MGNNFPTGLGAASQTQHFMNHKDVVQNETKISHQLKDDIQKSGGPVTGGLTQPQSTQLLKELQALREEANPSDAPQAQQFANAETTQVAGYSPDSP